MNNGMWDSISLFSYHWLVTRAWLVCFFLYKYIVIYFLRFTIYTYSYLHKYTRSLSLYLRFTITQEVEGIEIERRNLYLFIRLCKSKSRISCDESKVLVISAVAMAPPYYLCVIFDDVKGVFRFAAHHQDNVEHEKGSNIFGRSVAGVRMEHVYRMFEFEFYSKGGSKGLIAVHGLFSHIEHRELLLILLFLLE